jgi:virginiamycin A acetyltransferase
MPLGSYSYSHSFVREISEIGRYCSIGANLKVVQNTHPLDRVSSSPVFYSPQKLREWGASSYTFEHVVDFEPIGDDVRLRSGIHIGTGAIIAAGSIVTRDVEPYAIVAGIPAKLVRRRFDKPLTTKLLATGWWQFTPKDLMPLYPEDPKVFATSFIKAKKGIEPTEEVRLRLRQYLRNK